LILVLLGPPGSGKGTQAERIKQRYGIVHISTGDLFRAALAQQTPLGRAVREYVQSGRLVPDALTTDLVASRILEPDCREGFVLDGFPRTPGQVTGLDRLLQEHDLCLDAVLYFEVSEDTAVERLAGRRVCEGCGATYHVRHMPPRLPGRCDRCGGRLVQRADDRPEVVRTRLRVYDRETRALVEEYERRGLLRRISADPGPGVVAAHVAEVLDALGARSAS